ncbi:uncharacterized protein LOC115078928 isoform X2 [Rhinatrema bivittatum]|uniref:uncharacterized protein LOC115078928 isoform X2 n=1 Tax=Rhinatrema bivittatum TaxID=194408 RepID=UPI00112600EF|nr:uncharacterized protein LOC115078928 isoform X2 [Rhinatrema bivittatum]
MPRGHCWSPEEVRLLLAEIRGSGGVRLLMASTSRPNEALWRDICSELAAQGYPRNVAQCRAKWKKMKQAFYSERAARRQAQGWPQGLCSSRLYGLLRRLWKQAGRPVFGERRLPDVRKKESRTERQEGRSDVRHLPYSPEGKEEFGRQSWPERSQACSEEDQPSASEEQNLFPAQRINDPLDRQRSSTLPGVQVKEEEEDEEESDLSFSSAAAVWDVASAGEQEMSDLSYPDLSPAQRTKDPLGRQRSPTQPEHPISQVAANVSASPVHYHVKSEPQSQVQVKDEDEEEESDLSFSNAAPAWDTASVEEQEMSDQSYPEYSFSREAAGIFALPASRLIKSEPQRSSCSAEMPVGQTAPSPLSNCSTCGPYIPPLPVIASITSFAPSLSIKQEISEREADAPPEHGASPAAGAGTMLGDQAAAADLQGVSVVSLLQSMQQILTQLLHTSQQQQALLESLANDTISHMHLISDNLVQVGETLQEMLLRARSKNNVK